MKCPKCSYERQPTDDVPYWQCPACQVAYNKVAHFNNEGGQDVDTPPLLMSSKPTRKQKTDTLRHTVDELGEVDMRIRYTQAARGQKMVIYSILLNYIVFHISQANIISDIPVLLLHTGVGIYALKGLINICSGLNKTKNMKILYLVLALYPVINVIIFIYLSVKTTKMLRAAGYKVGLLGIKS